MPIYCIEPSRLIGKLQIPPSKSISHRAIICASLSKGESIIRNVALSKDIEATNNAMKKFGASLSYYDGNLYIDGSKGKTEEELEINCKESGSTLRFLIPLGSLMQEGITFTGSGRLIERPLEPYYEIFKAQGIGYENNSGKLPLRIMGRLRPGEFNIRGDVSSQFVSGLLFALPLLRAGSKIKITTPLESRPYIDLTLDVLRSFSIEITNNNYNEFLIEGNQEYKPQDYTIEGDFSQAAFFLVAGVLGSDITCTGLNDKSLQGDRFIIDLIREMGGSFEENSNVIKALPGKTKGRIIDAAQIPDLVPILTVLGALSEGTTNIINAGRLRLKESDRLSAITEELNSLGGIIKEEEASLIIHGVEHLKGGHVKSHNDHRIAMALAIASTRCKAPVVIDGLECIEKSYPNFIEDFKKLGGKINEWNVGK